MNRTGKKFSKEWIKKASLSPLDGFMLDKGSAKITAKEIAYNAISTSLSSERPDLLEYQIKEYAKKYAISVISDVARTVRFKTKIEAGASIETLSQILNRIK